MRYLFGNKIKTASFILLGLFILLVLQVYQVVQLSIDHENQVVVEWSSGDQARLAMVQRFQSDCVDWIREKSEKDFEEAIKNPYDSFECARDKGMGELIDVKESVSYESVDIPFPLSFIGREFIFGKNG